MAAYLIAHVKIKDLDQWKIYINSVGATMKAFGAETVFQGKKVAVLKGDHQYNLVGVIKFPDQAAIDNWHSSEAYQALIPTRTKAADLVLITYDA